MVKEVNIEACLAGEEFSVTGFTELISANKISLVCRGRLPKVNSKLTLKLFNTDQEVIGLVDVDVIRVDNNIHRPMAVLKTKNDIFWNSVLEYISLGENNVFNN